VRVDKKLRWDAAAARFPDSPEANALMSREYRPGWDPSRPVKRADT
jgi:hypothetical protein